MNKKEIIDSYIVGGVLEGYALAQSIAFFFEADFIHLEYLLSQMQEQIAQSGDFKKISVLDMQFHNFLTSKYDCELLHALTSRTSRNTVHYLYFQQWAEIQILDIFHSRHQKIIDAMRSKNPVLIEQVVRDHYAETGYRLGEYVESQTTGGISSRQKSQKLLLRASERTAKIRGC